jgi:tetratricopeptide (TPR) repeat protein
MRLGKRPESSIKKRRTSHSRIDTFSNSNGFEIDRKQSLQPKKKSKPDVSHESAYQRIFKRTIQKDKRVNTEALERTEDMRIKDMMSYYKAKEYSEAITVGKAILSDDSINLDALYIVGLSSSMLDRHEFTIKHFETLLSLHPTYKKNVYLFLSIAYKKQGDTESSFNVLNKALQLFESFFEAYVRKPFNSDL